MIFVCLCVNDSSGTVVITPIPQLLAYRIPWSFNRFEVSTEIHKVNDPLQPCHFFFLFFLLYHRHHHHHHLTYSYPHLHACLILWLVLKANIRWHQVYYILLIKGHDAFGRRGRWGEGVTYMWNNCFILWRIQKIHLEQTIVFFWLKWNFFYQTGGY